METSTPALTLADVLEQHPTLCDNGAASFDLRPKDREQHLADFDRSRAALAGREQTVSEIAAWLRQNIKPIKTPNTNSYYMKHIVERALGRYVSNGELIAAALVAGYTHKYDHDRRSPNLALGMSLRDVKKFKPAL